MTSTLQLVQEARGYMHVCAAYVDGALVQSWPEHPREGDALRDLLAWAEGRQVAPLAFVPRKFEDWGIGERFCKCAAFAECGCDRTWPPTLDDLRPHLIEVSREPDDGWPLGHYPVDWLAAKSENSS